MLGFGFRVTGTPQRVGVDESVETSRDALKATQKKQAQLEEHIKALEEQQRAVVQKSHEDTQEK